jgi:hypothetical protein
MILCQGQEVYSRTLQAGKGKEDRYLKVDSRRDAIYNVPDSRHRSMKKKPQTRSTSPKGTRRIEAWIYTVINPLIESLKIERTFLSEKNWTWRYIQRNLVSIEPLERYINSVHQPNFDDFFTSNPKVERMREQHDEQRAALLEHCLNAFDHLTARQDFQQKVTEKLVQYGDYPGGATPREDFSKLIAEYIINKTKDLPSHYTTAGFWSQFGQELLGFRTGRVFEELDVTGEELSKVDESLLTALKNLRTNLCKKYDIPPAPTVLAG